MPNYVTNKIEFHGEQENVKKVLELIKGEDDYIDFEKIIPMPDNIFRGNLGREERELYGTNNWYDWSIENWGTKWNTCSSYLEDDNTIIFDTAWSAPIPVFCKLAEICYENNVWFDGKWADEDRGYNIGVFESNCEETECVFNYEYLEDCSSEAFEVYVELNGESECIGKDENGNWISYDCDTCPNRDNC
jgi:hypothetical protein